MRERRTVLSLSNRLVRERENTARDDLDGNVERYHRRLKGTTWTMPVEWEKESEQKNWANTTTCLLPI